ncbi:MAG: hypothetical protein IIY21_21130 [Clostridiales bacterium]|nr:hypothetical protein [Clostridiales bacterium]
MKYSSEASTQNEECEMFYGMGREIVRNEIMRDNEPRETAMEIITNLAAILDEIKHQVDSIDMAIYGNRVEDSTTNEKPPKPPMLVILEQQREIAEDILKSIVHIREGLWR